MIKPPEADFARYAIWFGIILLVGSRLIHPRDEAGWFIVGAFFVIFGLLVLPKHPGS